MKSSLQFMLTGSISLMTILCPKPSYAQTINPANNPDFATFATINGFAFVGTAMIESPITNQLLSAIVATDNYGTNVFLQLDDDNINALQLNYPYQLNSIDVAIADDLNNPGKIYHIVFTGKLYNSTNTHELVAEEIRVSISGGTVTLLGSSGLITISPNIPNHRPSSIRIDAIPNENNLIAGMSPSIDSFLYLFTDITGSTKINKTDNTGMPTTAVTTVLSDTSSSGKDVAAFIDKTSNSDVIAAIVSLNGGNLSTTEFNTNTLVANTTLLSSGNTFFNPRIEAFGYYDPINVQTAKWAVVVDSYYNSPTLGRMDLIQVFTELTPTAFIANPTIGGGNEYPTIAAGLGHFPTLPPNNIGNNQYTYAWGATNSSIPNYYSQNLDYLGIPINPNDVFTVNFDPVNTTSDPWDAISMAHSCNTGRGMIVAWNEGSRIKYKIKLDDNYQFRPGNDNTTFEIPKPIQLYPNPANNYFYIQNGTKGEKVNVINSLGAIVYEDIITNELFQINTTLWSNGLYYVNFKDNMGKKQQLKLSVVR